VFGFIVTCPGTTLLSASTPKTHPRSATAPNSAPAGPAHAANLERRSLLKANPVDEEPSQGTDHSKVLSALFESA
jgi:hypothetical protein